MENHLTAFVKLIAQGIKNFSYLHRFFLECYDLLINIALASEILTQAYTREHKQEQAISEISTKTAAEILDFTTQDNGEVDLTTQKLGEILLIFVFLNPLILQSIDKNSLAERVSALDVDNQKDVISDLSEAENECSEEFALTSPVREQGGVEDIDDDTNPSINVSLNNHNMVEVPQTSTQDTAEIDYDMAIFMLMNTPLFQHNILISQVLQGERNIHQLPDDDKDLESYFKEEFQSMNKAGFEVDQIQETEPNSRSLTIHTNILRENILRFFKNGTKLTARDDLSSSVDKQLTNSSLKGGKH